MNAVTENLRTTMDLLEAAKAREPNVRELARKAGLRDNALHVSKGRGHLSPSRAAALAAFLGLDPARWILIATAEANQQPILKKLASSVQNS